MVRELPREQWADMAWMSVLRRAMLVHRLREVTALLGFTRFEATAPDEQGELPANAPRSALSREQNWLPAHENYSEGIFLEFDPNAVRAENGATYAQLSALARLLIAEIAVKCDCAEADLKERIYAHEASGRFGVLIYGAADAAGTLVAAGRALLCNENPRLLSPEIFIP